MINIDNGIICCPELGVVIQGSGIIVAKAADGFFVKVESAAAVPCGIPAGKINALSCQLTGNFLRKAREDIIFVIGEGGSEIFDEVGAVKINIYGYRLPYGVQGQGFTGLKGAIIHVGIDCGALGTACPAGKVIALAGEGVGTETAVGVGGDGHVCHAACAAVGVKLNGTGI